MTDPADASASTSATPHEASTLDNVQWTSTPVDPADPKGMHFGRPHPFMVLIGILLPLMQIILVSSVIYTFLKLAFGETMGLDLACCVAFAFAAIEVGIYAAYIIAIDDSKRWSKNSVTENKVLGVISTSILVIVAIIAYNGIVYSTSLAVGPVWGPRIADAYVTVIVIFSAFFCFMCMISNKDSKLYTGNAGRS